MNAIRLLVVLTLLSLDVFAQNVGIGTPSPAVSAILELNANDRGILVPRMTSFQRAAISLPATGLLVYDTDTAGFWYFNGSIWVNLSVPFVLPYMNEISSGSPIFGIKNTGSGPAIYGFGVSGPAFRAVGTGGGLFGATMRIENSNPGAIGLLSTTNSVDANMVVANAGTGDIIRGFSGPSAGTLVYRLLNDGTISTTGKIGIGSSTPPVSALEVTGAVKIADGTQGNGRVLTSNNDGLASWQSPASVSLNTGFSARCTSQVLPASALLQKIAFGFVQFNDGGLWNNTLNEYTAPASGVYQFDARIHMRPNLFSGTKNFTLAICVNGAFAQRIDISDTYNGFAEYRPQYQVSGLVKCNVNDKVSVQLYSDSGADVAITADATAFSGFRVY